jgi:hypothetical protein
MKISTSHATVMVNFVANLTAEAACEVLRGAGMTCSPEDVQIIAREERWAVSLPGERIAWFPASELGNKRLAIEHRLFACSRSGAHIRRHESSSSRLAASMFAKWFLADAIRGVSFIVAKRIRGWRRGSAAPSARSSPSNTQKLPK